MYTLLASAVQILAGGAIDDPNSPLIKNEPYKYSHHQIVSGLAVDITLTVLCLSWMVYVWYSNYGPGAKKTGANIR